ncbi:uncharacterized protein TNCV_2044631 [Trichonephila clavipes]|nr:uncharacterized protein TNCV_2044631 [Trichonephila clavipes]
MCNSGLDMQSFLKGKSGLAITFVLKCFACPYRVEFSSSNFHEGTQIATINTRFVCYAFNWKGAEAGRMFCGVMNLPQPPALPFSLTIGVYWPCNEAHGNKITPIKSSIERGKSCQTVKCLSGKNRLTEHEIDNLQSYYGSAIRRNHSSVQNMRQAIWAIFLHKLSTDEYPQHGFCPIGEDSWCGFKKAEASGKVLQT